MNQTRLFVFVTSLLITAQSFGAIWIEPYIGHKIGAQSFTLSNYTSNNYNGEYDFPYNGLAYGGKLGYEFLFLAVGLQYERSSIKERPSAAQKPAGSTYPADDEFDMSHLGVFGTFTLIPFINITASYFLNTKLSDTNGSDKNDEYEGSGYSLGLGFTLLPFISLNVDYRMITLDNSTISGSEIALPDNNTTEIDINEILFSVSLPLSL